MPIIKVKTSTTSGAVPANGSLQQGEIVANLANNIIWIGNAAGNPIKLVDTMGQQDSNSVSITGGTINGTSISATTASVSSLSFTGERLYYDEGTNAATFTANWNNATTYNMADFGGLGNVTAHGWTSGPANYTLSLSGIPAHTEVRYEVFWHMVDSLDTETNELFTTNDSGEVLRLRWTKQYLTAPAISSQAAGTTASWNGNRFYSYAPWAGSATLSNDQQRNGYFVIDTGWYSHTLSTFSARHYMGADQAQADEAMYLSHVKLYIRGGATQPITSISTSSTMSADNTALITQNAAKTFIDNNMLNTVKNVYVWESGGTFTYTKSGNDVKKLRVICVGGGGGGRGYGESGGAGGYAERMIDAAAISTVTVTVGAGGGGGGYFGYSPAGGTTSFGSYMSASGGFGANNHGAHIGGHGGIGSNANVISYGGGGKGHNNGVNNPSNSAVGRGGAGFFGGSRNSHHSSPRPADHGAPGGGGTGSVGGSGGNGSDGRPGCVIVYEMR